MLFQCLKVWHCGVDHCKAATVATVIVLVAMALIGVLVPSLVIGFTGELQRNTFNLIPGDTLLYNYSSTFYVSLKLQDKEKSIKAGEAIYIYLLDGRPNLHYDNTLRVNQSFNLSGHSHSEPLHFYLYEGSVFSISACAVANEAFMFPKNKGVLKVGLYFMSGQEAFDSWKHRRVPHHPGVVYRRMNITTVCSEQNTELHETIKDSNLSYFFVFQNHQDSHEVYIHFNLSIERYEYLPDNRINDKNTWTICNKSAT